MVQSKKEAPAPRTEPLSWTEICSCPHGQTKGLLEEGLMVRCGWRDEERGPTQNSSTSFQISSEMVVMVETWMQVDVGDQFLAQFNLLWTCWCHCSASSMRLHLPLISGYPGDLQKMSDCSNEYMVTNFSNQS
ncbi:hypothetical protein ILYODFUR_035969 [Ilyodon furcidens]|uniref:Uncharacterized protein n=1 Tax=Ilyodon furcidens TaxID=33524 RepID=A0ABV0SRY7_9TELE